MSRIHNVRNDKSGTQHMTAKVREMIEELWKKNNLLFNEGGRPGVNIDEILEEGDRINQADKESGLEPWILIYDEFLSWFVSFSSVIFSALHQNEKKNKDQLRASTVLAGAITSMLFAIRRLVVTGHDVAAKQVLRSLCEYSEVFVLLCLRKDLAPMFCETDMPEKSNEFWHRYISKGKARKAIDQAWHSTAGQDIDEIRQWRQEEYKILSTAAHPSFIAAFMAVAPPGADEGAGWLGFLGYKAEVSIRTLKFAIMTMSEVVLFSSDIPFGDEEGASLFLDFDENDELHVHVKNGRSLLVYLTLWIISEQKSEILAEKRSIDHWFQGQAISDATKPGDD